MNAQITHNFTYHPPTGFAVVHHQRIRDKAKELALLIDEVLPACAGREKATAITHCENAMMWACAGIARHGSAADEKNQNDKALNTDFSR